MKKFLLCLTLALSFIGIKASAEVPVIYGFQTFSDSDSPKGVYTVRAEKDAQPEIYWSDGDLMGNGGAVYVEGKYYVLNYLDFFGSLVWSYLVCNLDAKTYDFSMYSDYSPKDAGSALTFDPATGLVYSVCIDEANAGKYTLSTMNIDTGTKTPVAPLEKRMLAMATTLDGILYGIGTDGSLYTINKANGLATLVGATGISPNDVNQSAVIDYNTNIMYWAAMTAEGAGLYTVDLATGAATLLSAFTDNNQLVGITLRQNTQKTTSPASVENLKLDFYKAELNGKVSFTMPTTDISGNALEGTLSYSVSCNGNNVAEGNAEAGAEVVLDVEVTEEGNASFTVVVKNESGDASVPSTATRWVGPDTPTAVTDLSAEANGNEVTLFWNISETGVNGGYVDTEQVRYYIVRKPENVVVAYANEGTTFTETIDLNGMSKISYTVTPYVGTKMGATVESGTVVIGNGLTVPFKEDLTKPGCIDMYTVVDANEDNFRWYYSSYDEAVVADYTTSCETNDDWLFTPHMHLDANTNYKVTLNLRSGGIRNWDTYEDEDAYAGNIGVSLGKQATVEAMTQTVIADTEVTKAEAYDLASDVFQVDESGNYVLGISHTGKSGYPALRLYSIAMEAVETDGVYAVSTDNNVGVFTTPGMLSIDNRDGSHVTVCTTSGHIVYNGNTSAHLSLSAGIYLVRTNSRTIKVLVR